MSYGNVQLRTNALLLLLGLAILGFLLALTFLALLPRRAIAVGSTIGDTLAFEHLTVSARLTIIIAAAKLLFTTQCRQ